MFSRLGCDLPAALRLGVKPIDLPPKNNYLEPSRRKHFVSILSLGMRTQRSADITSGSLVAALGVVAVVAAMRIGGTAGDPLHPRTFPNFQGWILVVAGVALAVNAYKYRGGDRMLSWPDRAGALRVLVTLANLVIYLVLIEPLGLALATFVFTSFQIWFTGRYRILVSAGLGAAIAILVFLLFIGLLNLPLPSGWMRP